MGCSDKIFGKYFGWDCAEFVMLMGPPSRGPRSGGMFALKSMLESMEWMSSPTKKVRWRPKAESWRMSAFIPTLTALHGSAKKPPLS